jgi:hypothetical protein
MTSWNASLKLQIFFFVFFCGIHKIGIRCYGITKWISLSCLKLLKFAIPKRRYPKRVLIPLRGIEISHRNVRPPKPVERASTSTKILWVFKPIATFFFLNGILVMDQMVEWAHSPILVWRSLWPLRWLRNSLHWFIIRSVSWNLSIVAAPGQMNHLGHGRRLKLGLILLWLEVPGHLEFLIWIRMVNCGYWCIFVRPMLTLCSNFNIDNFKCLLCHWSYKSAAHHLGIMVCRAKHSNFVIVSTEPLLCLQWKLTTLLCLPRGNTNWLSINRLHHYRLLCMSKTWSLGLIPSIVMNRMVMLRPLIIRGELLQIPISNPDLLSGGLLWESILIIKLLVESLDVLNELCKLIMIVATDSIFIRELLCVIKDHTLLAVFLTMLVRLCQVIDNLAHPRRKWGMHVCPLLFVGCLGTKKLPLLLMFSFGLRTHAKVVFLRWFEALGLVSFKGMILLWWGSLSHIPPSYVDKFFFGKFKLFLENLIYKSLPFLLCEVASRVS